ncbi:hypothetical protein BGZ76_008155, partial [Entomortierella beljakovae]
MISSVQGLMQEMAQKTFQPLESGSPSSSRRPHVPNPFTPAFTGDARILSFRAYKAKLNGVIQRFENAFETDCQC